MHRQSFGDAFVTFPRFVHLYHSHFEVLGDLERPRHGSCDGSDGRGNERREESIVGGTKNSDRSQSASLIPETCDLSDTEKKLISYEIYIHVG